jgi:hypothetical protein
LVLCKTLYTPANILQKLFLLSEIQENLFAIFLCFFQAVKRRFWSPTFCPHTCIPFGTKKCRNFVVKCRNFVLLSTKNVTILTLEISFEIIYRKTLCVFAKKKAYKSFGKYIGVSVICKGLIFGPNKHNIRINSYISPWLLRNFQALYCGDLAKIRLLLSGFQYIGTLS